MASQVHIEIPEADGQAGNVLTLELARADVPALTDEAGLRMNRYPVPWREDGAEFIVFQVGGPGTQAHVEIPQIAEGQEGNVATIQVARAALADVHDEENLSILPALGAGLVLLHEPAPTP